MPELAVMGAKGDTKIIWDVANEDEVANARRTFADLRKKGYLAFRVNDDDASKGEQINRFDEEAEKMILAPPMQGG